eukprot:1145734-Pelagomonas_calceolata.AAC.1
MAKASIGVDAWILRAAVYIMRQRGGLRSLSDSSTAKFTENGAGLAACRACKDSVSTHLNGQKARQRGMGSIVLPAYRQEHNFVHKAFSFVAAMEVTLLLTTSDGSKRGNPSRSHKTKQGS